MMMGQPHKSLGISELGTPLDLKNSILGKKVLWGSDKRYRGSSFVKRRIWGFEKPRFFKKLMTRSGFCGVLKVTYLVAELASLGEKPQVSMRYETVKEGSLDESEVEK